VLGGTDHKTHLRPFAAEFLVADFRFPFLHSPYL
jgi:hypothetical protein